MSAAKTIQSLSFEEALGELESIVKNLERGETPLESSISSYERGIELKKHCEKKLRDAREKIEKITVAGNGSVSTQPFDSTE